MSIERSRRRNGWTRSPRPSLRSGRRWLAIPALIALCGAGCVSRAYPGPPRPPTEVALVQGGSDAFFMRNEYVQIMTIDGAKAAGDWSSGESRVEVLPGEHTFGVNRFTEYTAGGLFATLAQFDQGVLLVNVTVPVEAGHRYAIEFAQDGSGAYIVTRSPVDDAARQRGAVDGRAVCAPRKPQDDLNLACAF